MHILRIFGKGIGVLTAALLVTAPAAVSADTMTSGASNTNDSSMSISIEGSSGDVSVNAGDPVGDSPSISSTGPDSDASVRTDVSNRANITNKNDVTITNTNQQTAKTGECKVVHNTFGGSAACASAKVEKQVQVPAEEENAPEAAISEENQAPQPEVLGAAVGGMGGGLGAGELVNTGSNSVPNILVGLAILGAVSALTYATTGKRRFVVAETTKAGGNLH
ncbi:MAG TPA: hypothetical protein VL737_03210 [Candidatus Pristimantibacillus sp.]|nr:hypothetical protein [Candidatus Pristimantibacillus sp.]